jgi:hypothetical protein
VHEYRLTFGRHVFQPAHFAEENVTEPGICFGCGVGLDRFGLGFGFGFGLDLFGLGLDLFGLGLDLFGLGFDLFGFGFEDRSRSSAA